MSEGTKPEERPDSDNPWFDMWKTGKDYGYRLGFMYGLTIGLSVAVVAAVAVGILLS